MTRSQLALVAVVSTCTCLTGFANVAAGHPSAAPLRVVTSLSPAAALYGDPVTAEIEVDYESQTVNPSSIRVQPSFIPYVITAAPVVQHPRAGVVRFRYSLLCVTDGCLPTKGPRLLKLEQVTVTGLAGNQTVTATASWPTLRISSRLASADRSGQIHFRNPATPPSVAYRFSPGSLSTALIAAAALCAIVALALAGRGLARLSRRSSERGLSTLELAIAYVRDSAGRSDPDRRRALELLAEAVGDQGEPSVAAAAAKRAWSKPPPTPGGATELADRAAGIRRGAG